MIVTSESRGNAAIAWAKGSKHKFYEDRYRMLPKSVPIVARQNRGDLFGVFDGIGSASKGMQAAQTMADALVQSDGVTKVFHCLEAADLIRDLGEIGVAARTLAQRSITKGTNDDVTVLLIEYEEA